MHKYDQIIEFWINKVGYDGWSDPNHSILSEIRNFEELMTEIGQGSTWPNQASSCLAYIILTDQLPRVLYSGQAKAYEKDSLAQKACIEGMSFLSDLPTPIHKISFIMPLMHSENIQHQKFSILHAQKIKKEASPHYSTHTEDFFKRAIQHHGEIERFGRFPIRNRELNREPTSKELEFVATLTD